MQLNLQKFKELTFREHTLMGLMRDSKRAEGSGGGGKERISWLDFEEVGFERGKVQI